MTYPWNDRGAGLSPLKLVVFVALFLPALWTAGAYVAGGLGARPLNEAIHQIGLWTIRFLFIALAVTPLRQVLQWPQLILVRRMLGVGAAAYVMIHFALYVTDEAFDLGKVASEIALRIYLTIGFVALCGLAVLAATSTDAMIRRLGGRRWQRLHRIVYVIALLGLVHYWMQSKLEVWEPTVFAGFYLWLMGYRGLVWALGLRARRLPVQWVAGLGVVVALAVALGEALYFHLAYKAPLARVLGADLSLQTGVRPAIVVLAAGLLIAAAEAVRAALKRPAKRKLGYA